MSGRATSPVYLGAGELTELLPLPALAEELARVFTRLCRGEAAHGPRHVLSLPGGALGTMTGAAASALLGAKVVAVLPGNRARGLNPHQGLVCLLDPETGLPLATGDAAAITGLRTAAASLLATRLLAREDARVLTVVGTGHQAGLHIEAMRAARKLKEVRVVGRNQAAARALAEKHGAMVYSSLEGALPGSDILCLCTGAQTPYLRSRFLPAGIHVNAIGACRPGHKEIELDPSQGNFSAFVESRAAAQDEAEELKPFSVEKSKVTELGEVLTRERPGRRSRTEITFYKGVGIGLEDICALALAYRLHKEQKP